MKKRWAGQQGKYDEKEPKEEARKISHQQKKGIKNSFKQQ